MRQERNKEKISDRKKKKEFTFTIEYVDPPPDYDFDLEEWLAEILVDYYLKINKEKRD